MAEFCSLENGAQWPAANIILDTIYSPNEYARMDLDTYIRSRGITEADIALRAGCSQASVNRIRNGEGNPTFHLLCKISEATDGEFTPGEFAPKESLNGGAK